MDNTENRKNRRSSPMNETQLLMEHYTKSIDDIGSDAGNEKIIQKIKEMNRRRGQSIWTDEPVLKPEKSVWLDDEPAPGKVTDDGGIEQRPVGAVQEKKLIAKPKTELTLEVSQSGERRIMSSAKQTVMLELGKKPPHREPKVKLDIQEKQFPDRKPTRRELSLSLPSAQGEKPVITEASPKAPRRVVVPVYEPKPQPAVNRAASRQEISISVPSQAVRPSVPEQHSIPQPQQPPEPVIPEPVRQEIVQPAPAAPEVPVQPVQPEPVQPAVPAPEPVHRPVKKAVAAREEKAAKELQKELEKYEKLREETIKRQRERERLSKNGRNDFEFSFVNAAISLTVLLVAAIALAVINRDFSKFPDISAQSWFSGEFSQQTDNYYNDTLPYKKNLSEAGKRFSALYGFDTSKKDDEKSASSKSAKKPDLKDESSEQETSESTSDVQEEKTTQTVSKDEKVIIIGSGDEVRAVEGCSATAEDAEAYAQAVNAWTEDLGSYINVYSMLIPSSAAYYMPEDKRGSFPDQEEVIKAANDALEDAHSVDIFDALGEHTDEYIYSRTDERWQPLGAYYAAQVFADEAGAEFPDIADYDQWRIEDFVGSFYAESGYDPALASAHDTFTYHKPDNYASVTYYNAEYEEPAYGEMFFDSAEGTNCFSAILGSDTQPCRIDTDSASDRTLVIFKDGYGNALAPYLTHGFSRIYVCDVRYIDLNCADFCRYIGCTDVLFAFSLPTVSSGAAAEYLDSIR